MCMCVHELRENTHTHTHKNQNNFALEDLSSADGQRNTILCAQKDPSFIGTPMLRWQFHHDEAQGADTKRTEGHVKSLREAWQEGEVGGPRTCQPPLPLGYKGKESHKLPLGTDAGLLHREHRHHPCYLFLSCDCLLLPVSAVSSPSCYLQFWLFPLALQSPLILCLCLILSGTHKLAPPT